MATTIDILVPDLGDFEDVEIIEILVSSGDTVAREDGLITIETDKAAMDVPSPENGVIEELTVAVGDKVSAGSIIGKLTVEVSDTVVIAPALDARADGRHNGIGVAGEGRWENPKIRWCADTRRSGPWRFRGC